MKHVTGKLQITVLVILLAGSTFEATAMGGLRLAAFLYTNPFDLVSLRTVFAAELEFAPLEVLLELNVIFCLVFLEA